MVRSKFPCLPFDILSRQELEWNLLLHQDSGNTLSTDGCVECIKFEDHCSESKLEVKQFGCTDFTIVCKSTPSLYTRIMICSTGVLFHYRILYLTC